MAIVNTPIGPNSFQFDYSTETTVEEILAGLHAEIVRVDEVEEPVLDEFGEPTYEQGDQIFTTESQQKRDPDTDELMFEQGAPIMEDVQVPVLDGEGNPTYEQGDQIFTTEQRQKIDPDTQEPMVDEFDEPIMEDVQVPVLDEFGEPTYEQGPQIFTTESRQKEDEFGEPMFEQGDPIMEDVQVPVLDGEGQPTYEQGPQIFTTIVTSVHGWELWDGEAGSNSRCYRALNKDGITYKYVVLDLATTNVLKLVVYENWNPSTHTGTNKCNQSDIANFAGKVVSNQPGQIFLFINERWFAITTRDPFNGALNNDQTKQGIFGCFEFTRDNTEDTGEDGLPCFMWTNTSMFFQGNGCGYSPKFKAGQTGTNAVVELSTILGKTVTTGTKFQNFVPATKNPWNDKDWALTLYVHEPNFCVRGRIFGLKATTYDAYLILDRIITKTDADFMYDADGVDTEHHIVHCSTHATNATNLQGRVIIPV